MRACPGLRQCMHIDHASHAAGRSEWPGDITRRAHVPGIPPVGSIANLVPPPIRIHRDDQAPLPASLSRAGAFVRLYIIFTQRTSPSVHATATNPSHLCEHVRGEQAIRHAADVRLRNSRLHAAGWRREAATLVGLDRDIKNCTARQELQALVNLAV